MNKICNKASSENNRFWLGLGFSALLALLFLFSISAYLHLTKLEDPFQAFSGMFVLFMLVYTALQSFLIVRLGIIGLGRTSLKSIGWRIDSWKSDMAVGLLGGLISVAAIYFIGDLFGSWNWSDFRDHILSFSPSQRLMFLLIGLNAGFIEESLFRGFLQPAAIQKLGLVFGVTLTSFVFAAYHLNFHDQAFIGKFILGIIFGILRMSNRSLWRPAIAHALMWIIVGSM